MKTETLQKLLKTEFFDIDYNHIDNIAYRPFVAGYQDKEHPLGSFGSPVHYAVY
jgi:hypothetical protein